MSSVIEVTTQDEKHFHLSLTDWITVTWKGKGDSLISVDNELVEFFVFPNDHRYMISLCGRVWSARTEKLIAARHLNGFTSVSLNSVNEKVNILMAITFHKIQAPYDMIYARHIDGDTSNNRLENLDCGINIPMNVIHIEYMLSDVYRSFPLAPKYLVYEDGRIRSHNREKHLQPRLVNGYLRVKIRGKDMLVHRVVALTYHVNDDPVNKKFVHHIDGCKTNNHVCNLMWVTHKQNANGPHQKDKKNIPVIQYLDDGTFEKEYKSAVDASRQTGTNATHIADICRNRQGRNATKDKHGVSYKWRYKTPKPVVAMPLDVKPIEGFNDRYFVSRDGRVFSQTDSSLIELHYEDDGGYLAVQLCRDSIKYRFRVHRLVLEVFMENKPDEYRQMDVNHKDGTKTNNHFDNLEYLTKSDHAKFTVEQTGGNRRETVMYDMKTGDVLRSFKMCTDAAEYIGAHETTISRICRGLLKNTGDYGFMYMSDVPEGCTNVYNNLFTKIVLED